MPAGPAPTIARLRSPFDLTRSDLPANPHASTRLDDAAPPVRHAVDLRETVETDPHHAIGRAFAALDRRLADAAQPGGENCRGGPGAGRNQDRAPLDDDGDRRRAGVRPP